MATPVLLTMDLQMITKRYQYMKSELRNSSYNVKTLKEAFVNN